MSTVAALIEERRGYVAHGKTGRVAQVDAELARFGIAVDDTPEVERAVVTPEVETAVVKRGPGRPRKEH